MKFDASAVLRRNYQKVSTNRFVVDSPRFWRLEFHPRFKDIFDYQDFKDTFDAAHQMISYKFKPEHIELMAKNLYNYFAGKRFAYIPKHEPDSPAAFLSELYFTLQDIFPAISFKDYELDSDDFNLVYHEANAGKEDNTLLATDEHNNQNSKHGTQLDILTEGNQESNDTAATENVDDESWQNNFNVNDTFVSPQNQGVTPTITNRDPTNDATRPLGTGVSGIPQKDESPYTTATTKNNFGESNKAQSNTSQQSQESRERLTQNNDARTSHEIDTEQGMNQSQENRTKKVDQYKESLDFNKGARLQDFFDLTNVRLWKEILSRLMSWVKLADIATSERNYNDCPFYD